MRNIDWTRRVAVVGLLASGAFFLWWGLAASWFYMGPFFAGLVLSWLVAAEGVNADRAWGPGFAAGLSSLSALAMLPSGTRAPVAIFLAAQVVVLSAIGMRSLARPRPRQRWRFAILGFSAGAAAPWLVVAALLPGQGLGSTLLAAGAVGLASVGVWASFRGRTWGLFAMLAAAPLLLAIPESGACHASTHDRAGELAALGMAFATLPWLGPMRRALRSPKPEHG